MPTHSYFSGTTTEPTPSVAPEMISHSATAGAHSWRRPKAARAAHTWGRGASMRISRDSIGTRCLLCLGRPSTSGAPRKRCECASGHGEASTSRPYCSLPCGLARVGHGPWSGSRIARSGPEIARSVSPRPPQQRRKWPDLNAVSRRTRRWWWTSVVSAPARRPSGGCSWARQPRAVLDGQGLCLYPEHVALGRGRAAVEGRNLDSREDDAQDRQAQRRGPKVHRMTNRTSSCAGGRSPRAGRRPQQCGRLLGRVLPHRRKWWRRRGHRPPSSCGIVPSLSRG